MCRQVPPTGCSPKDAYVKPEHGVINLPVVGREALQKRQGAVWLAVKILFLLCEDR